MCFIVQCQNSGRFYGPPGILRRYENECNTYIVSDGLTENEETANVAAIVSRLQPLVKRANDRDGQPLTSLGDDTDGVTGAGSDVFQKLKNILSEKFADAATAEIEMGMDIITQQLFCKVDSIFYH